MPKQTEIPRKHGSASGHVTVWLRLDYRTSLQEATFHQEPLVTVQEPAERFWTESFSSLFPWSPSGTIYRSDRTAESPVQINDSQPDWIQLAKKNPPRLIADVLRLGRSRQRFATRRNGSRTLRRSHTTTEGRFRSNGLLLFSFFLFSSFFLIHLSFNCKELIADPQMVGLAVPPSPRSRNTCH